MNSQQKLMSILVIGLIVSGLAIAQSVPRSQMGSSFDIRYGTVQQVDRVKIQSQAAKGAVMGGVIGAQRRVITIAANMPSKVP